MRASESVPANGSEAAGQPAGRVSVIVPTRNRPASLATLVGSLLRQTRPPDELIVIDQSTGRDSRDATESEVASAPCEIRAVVKLVYVRDPEIRGAAVARNRGMELASGDVWLFLDDDMLPEQRFVEELLSVYARQPSVIGVSGIIANYQVPPLWFRIWSHVFLRGPFFDERQPIYWNADRLRGREALRVTKFGSGLMSFRADVVRGIRFDDSLEGLPPGEDIDFCARLGPETVLVIGPRARIDHNQSLIGRSTAHWTREYAQGKLYAYRRNWRRGVFNRVCSAWFVAGCFTAAGLGSLRRRSLGPFRDLMAGVREAIRLAPTAR